MNDASARFHLAARMAHIEPFEVMEIQTLAREVEAQGRDVIHLEIGEPDFTTPRPIVEAALLLALGVLLDPEDEVLLTDPSYPCNRHFVHTLGGVPQLIPVGPESRYQLNAQIARRHWNPKTRIAMVATPSNPTGTMVTPEEVAELAALTRQKGATLLVDEIYHGLTYGVDARTALEVGDDVFVINSFSKYFQMTGWRLGWLVAPPQYVREVEKLAQNLFISPSTVAQHAALACFDARTIAIVEERRAKLDQRRRYLIPALESVGFRVPVIPQGAFYIYADSSALADDSFALARRILTEAGVAVTPGKDFGHHEPERHIRIAYTQPVARLEEAMARIGALLGGKRP